MSSLQLVYPSPRVHQVHHMPFSCRASQRRGSGESTAGLIVNLLAGVARSDSVGTFPDLLNDLANACKAHTSGSEEVLQLPVGSMQAHSLAIAEQPYLYTYAVSAGCKEGIGSTGVARPTTPMWLITELLKQQHKAAGLMDVASAFEQCATGSRQVVECTLAHVCKEDSCTCSVTPEGSSVVVSACSALAAQPDAKSQALLTSTSLSLTAIAGMPPRPWYCFPRVCCRRDLQAALQKFALSVQDTTLAPGGVQAALEHEWYTIGPVQTAAAAVVQSLEQAVVLPVVLPLHHHPFAAAATAGLLNLCFRRFDAGFVSSRDRVGALALRLHLQLAEDGWLGQQQRGIAATALSASMGMNGQWMSWSSLTCMSDKLELLVWHAW